MAKKSFLDSIEIPAPCEKSWDGMIGNDQKRFCRSCEKNIYNISEMTRGEVRKLLFQSKDKVCIRVEKDAGGKVQTLKKRLHKITRQAPIAAGILSASLTFSSLTYAQGDAVVGKTAATVSNEQKDETADISISGTISDQSGAIITNVSVTLRDVKNSLTRNVKSNDEGIYEFKNVGKSVYEIEFEASGFRKFIYQNLIVSKDNDLQLKITLESLEPTDGDVVANNKRSIEIIESPRTVNTVDVRKIESLPAQRNLSVLGLFPGTISSTKKKAKHQDKTSQISFTSYDHTGAVIPKALVKLTNQKTKAEFTITANQDGIAQFVLIPPGRYDVFVSSTEGFGDYQQVIQIKEAIEPNVKITLRPSSDRFLMGDFIVDWSDIPLFQAIAQEDNREVKNLINAGFDVNTKDTDGKTALHVAVEHENLEIVRFLLVHGAKVNVKSKNKRTPLSMLDNDLEDDNKTALEILRLLIAKGANVNVRNEDKETLLMVACYTENMEVVKILLTAGANPNLKDDIDGKTAIQKTKSEEIKGLLIGYGARGN